MTRGFTLNVQVGLVTEVCINCGTTFAAATDLVEELRRTHRTFYCPNGHGQHYNGKTEAERLREQLAEAERKATRLSANLDQAWAEANELDKAKRKLEREAKAAARRTTNGACTLCHRHFANVERHMKSKHAEQVVNAE